MKVLHDKVVHQGFGGYGSHAAKTFTGKVPENHYFLTEDPARLIPMKFVDIWNTFNLSLISPSKVRLWALYLAKENRRLNKRICVVMDPFHMYKDNSHSPEGRKNMVDILVAAMVSHTETLYLLVPYREWGVLN
jgi:hypothetical protein